MLVETPSDGYGEEKIRADIVSTKKRNEICAIRAMLCHFVVAHLKMRS